MTIPNEIKPKTTADNTNTVTGEHSVHRLVRIIESCLTCKGEGELECVHADLFRCYSCRGTGKNKTFRLGKVWGLGVAFEVYNEDYEYTGFRKVAACKIYVGPLLVNLRIPVSKVIYPNKQISNQGEMPNNSK